ncbi:hypothetical protein [Amphritea japonica]|uniref:hypothetical protein n=1 Tax=Amphritea japonica TaxID=452627 RepID=UPI00037E7A9B|nr:hypothetical protein [Amphritea japonica]
MPRNKHKRKASVHSKSKTVKSAKLSGLSALNPKIFVLLGLLFVVLGGYLLVFKSHGGAMPGFAMLSILIGVVTAIFASFSIPKKKTD